MAMVKKVETDVIVPVWFRGWSPEDLRATLRSLAAQVTRRPNWRAVIVDGSGPGHRPLVRRMVDAILRPEMVLYDELHLRTGAASDLLYQGVNMSRSRFVAYLEPGKVWDKNQLVRLVGMARQSRADVVAEGDITLEVDWLSDRADAFLPLLGSRILHTRLAYSRTTGWPRRRNDLPAVRADLWRQMVIEGAEVFTAVRPHVSEESTPVHSQMMLFSDA